MKLVVGLGNPGSQYAETRHNIGWMVLDRLADRHGRSGRGRQRDASSTIQLRYKGLELILAKPQTYMNDSGVAVRKLLARDRVPLGEMLVIADDFALPFGKLRFRESGSHGGHNGLRSIIDELGTEKYAGSGWGSGSPGAGRWTTCSRSSRPTSGRACRSCWTPRPTRWRRGRGRGRRRRRTGSTASSCRRRRRPARAIRGAEAGRGRRARGRVRRAPDEDGLAPDPGWRRRGDGGDGSGGPADDEGGRSRR